MATKSFTPNIGLIIASDLTPDAKANLFKIDNIAGSFSFLNSATINIEADNDINLLPKDDLNFGSATLPVGKITAYTAQFELVGTSSITGLVITNADIVDAAGIPYSKLNLVGAIAYSDLTDALATYIDSKASQASLDAHTSSTNNPHLTTAHQVGAYTSGETDSLLSAKVDNTTYSLHLSDFLNPHHTTAAQTGAYTIGQTDALLGAKADEADLLSHTTNTSNPHATTADQVNAYTKSEVDSLIAATGGGKVKVSIDDTTFDYLSEKVSEGTGITLSVSSPSGDESLVITNSDTGTAAVAAHNLAYSHGLIATAEQTANKDTATSLGTSDTKYPSQNAVKSYVDTGLGTKENTLTKGNLTGVANRTAVSGGTGAVIGSGASVDVNTTLLPSPGAGDVGKALISNGANSAVWTTVSTADEKIKISATDTTAAYLGTKIATGTGLSAAIENPAGNEYISLTNSDTGTSAVSAHNLAFNHSLIATAEQVANKDSTVTLGTSDTKYPTQNAVRAYIANTLTEAQEVHVAKSGRPFTSIQTAIDSITDASASKRYVIYLHPGTYTENIVLKDWVFIKGVHTYGCVLVGTVTGALSAGANAGIYSLSINTAPNSAANHSAIDVTGDFIFFDIEIVIVTGSSFNGAVKGINISSNQLTYMGIIGVVLYALAGTVTEFCGITFYGANTVNYFEGATTVVTDRATGTFVGTCLSATGDISAKEHVVYMQSLNPAFSGTLIGHRCTTVQGAASAIRIAKNNTVILKGAGTGTAYGTSLVTTGGATFRYDGISMHIDGFANEYVSTTGASDSQKLWITSTNKNLSQDASGLSVATPQDQNQTGFVRWGGSGNYYSYVAATGIFTLLRPGAGVVKSTPVTWVANQTVTLSTFSTHYVYIDSMGILRSTTSTANSIYDNNIVLFECWVDGSTDALITKENHPYEFTTAVSKAWHTTFGPLVTGLGATLTLLGATSARQVQIIGDDTLIDHGLYTSIPTNPGVAMTCGIYYVNASGKMAKDGADLTTFLSRYNNAGVPANAANNRRIVIRIGVIKDDLNSTSPKYVGVLDTVTYSSDANALAAISNGTVTPFPPELKQLEVVQLGFIAINGNGSGAGSIVANGVVVAKQAFGAALVGASAATQASLITTTTTNFAASGGISSVLSGADTSVQAALDTLARGISSRYVVSLSWTGTGPYTMSIPGTTHLRGTDPIVRARRLDAGSVYSVVYPDITIDDSNGDVVITSVVNFTGKVVIL